MTTYLNMHHSCCSGLDDLEAARSMSVSVRDLQCSCGWWHEPQEYYYRTEAVPTSEVITARNRAKLTNVRDGALKSPSHSISKMKSINYDWWSECTCSSPSSWYEQVQANIIVILFFFVGNFNILAYISQ